MLSNPDPPAQGKNLVPEKENYSFRDFRLSFRSVPPSGSHILPDAHPHICRLFVCFQGHLHVVLEREDEMLEVQVTPGNSLLCCDPEISLCCNPSPDQCAEALEVLGPTEVLLRLTENSALGAVLQKAISGGQCMYPHRPVSPDLRRRFSELRDAVRRDGVRKSAPLLMSRIMELVWQLARGDGAAPRLSEETLVGVEKARTILEENMETPPDLPTLASQVGMSLTKFKDSFALVHGMPPYAWLRARRLEKAMFLLHDGGRNVTEAAMEVGYSNLSHFAKVFAEYFGIKPSQVGRS
jgi:AraC-like DNA-binding protein